MISHVKIKFLNEQTLVWNHFEGDKALSSKANIEKVLKKLSSHNEKLWDNKNESGIYVGGFSLNCPRWIYPWSLTILSKDFYNIDEVKVELNKDKIKISGTIFCKPSLKNSCYSDMLSNIGQLFIQEIEIWEKGAKGIKSYPFTIEPDFKTFLKMMDKWDKGKAIDSTRKLKVEFSSSKFK